MGFHSGRWLMLMLEHCMLFLAFCSGSLLFWWREYNLIVLLSFFLDALQRTQFTDLTGFVKLHYPNVRQVDEPGRFWKDLLCAFLKFLVPFLMLSLLVLTALLPPSRLPIFIRYNQICVSCLILQVRSPVQLLSSAPWRWFQSVHTSTWLPWKSKSMAICCGYSSWEWRWEPHYTQWTVVQGIIICRIYHRLCGVMLKRDQPATSFLVVGKTVMQIKFGSTPASRQVIEKQAMSTQAINKAQNNIREHIHDA